MEKIGQGATEKDTSNENKFRQILGQKTVHLLAFFILVYVGVEVTIGGTLSNPHMTLCTSSLFHYRLDRHIHQRRARRRPGIWIRVRWLLRWYVCLLSTDG